MIMRFFDFDKYKGQKVAMHCKTEEEAFDFCDLMHKHHKKWFNGITYKQTTNYSNYCDETCYCFNCGTFGRKSWLMDKGYEILQWNDYMNKQFIKSDLRNGDVLVLRNGDVEIVIPETFTRITSKGGCNYLSNIKEDLTNSSNNDFDIVKIYRPKKTLQCCFDDRYFTQGELVFDRGTIEPIEITLEEIAKLKGVSVDRIRIVNG